VTEPEGFAFVERKNGDVVISYRGKHAATLRGRAAAAFLAKLESADPQAVMARVTGNYRRGNERRA
jgi:hypothetical protein